MNFTDDPRFNFARKQIDAINDENYTSVLDLFERACSEFSDSITFTCLGLSETTANLTLNVPSTRRIGSVGKPVGFQEVKLVGGSGKVVADGEAVKAFLVGRNSSLTETALTEFCRQDLTAYKVPKFIEFRDELPKSNVGKILRRELRQGTTE